MGFYLRRSKRIGKKGRINLSRSGISYSRKIGPFTFNTRRRGNVRLGKGFGFRF